MPDFKEKAAAGLQELLQNNKVESTAPPEATPAPVVEVPAKSDAPVETQTSPKIAEGTTTQFIDWDKEEEAPKPLSVDLRALAKKVGIDAENEDDFVTKLQSQKTADPYEGVPANLKKAIEYAKKGVDPLQLLKINSVDYSQIDPVQLYEADFMSRVADKEQGKLALETMNVFQKQYEGAKLKQQLEHQQKLAEQDLLNQVELSRKAEQQRNEQFTGQLQSELAKVESIENFKVLEKHRKAVYQEIAERGENPRYKTPTGYDYQRHIRDTFITSNWDRLKEHLGNRAKVEAIKEELKSVQNVNLGNNNERIPVGNSQGENVFDKLNKQSAEQRKAQVK